MLFGSTLTFADADYQVKCVPNSTMHNDILGCYIDEYKTADKKLNTAYKQKMAGLKKNRKEELQRLQRNWIKEKESKCVVDEANYGRESHFDAMQCEIDMTNDRIKFLKKYK
ncbi:DUF1311 domain-containing protein [Acinetobacter wuhouensis]|nr:DUF1311 domain-containing protein [Acinetobacter wuhouensis]RZG71159.1 DUF1311 domain-containing protein [Acinetobacter wuhouensis]RZG81543.1 DUF1311 domain-containing protein [Acinetobacter sp. WCHAc060033]